MNNRLLINRTSQTPRFLASHYKRWCENLNSHIGWINETFLDMQANKRMNQSAQSSRLVYQ